MQATQYAKDEKLPFYIPILLKSQLHYAHKSSSNGYSDKKIRDKTHEFLCSIRDIYGHNDWRAEPWQREIYHTFLSDPGPQGLLPDWLKEHLFEACFPPSTAR